MAKEKLQTLVEQLEETALYMEILGENDFKVRAFKKGAQAIASTEASLEEIVSGAVKVAGVGEGLKGAVKEFLNSGRVKAHEELALKIPSGVLELMRLPGLGPKKAMLIQSELGVNSIGELEYACRENRLLSLKGFGKSVQEKILKSIEDFKASEGKVRLDEAIELANSLQKKLTAKDIEVIEVGAIARHSEIIEVIEFCLVGKAAATIKAVVKLPWKNEPITAKENILHNELHAYSGALSSGLSARIWTTEKAPDHALMQWLCAGEGVREKIEKAPEKFEGWEFSWLESEWVGEQRQPKKNTYRVGRDGQVKGIFHCHTVFSDGVATLEEMVRGAEARGYEYIGISDHSQSAFYAQGLKPDRIREQAKLIKELQKKVSIRIFHGIESDILADGALDYDEDILENFDFIVGSIHSRFKMDEDTMTDRLVHAIKNPHITIWGHPTGRMLLARRGYSLRWDECLKAAAKSGVAIEINANPHRLDVDWRMGSDLEKFGVNVCINPDAHAVDGLDDTRLGEFMAEKAMLPTACILNMKSVEEMEKYLWERKKHAKR